MPVLFTPRRFSALCLAALFHVVAACTLQAAVPSPPAAAAVPPAADDDGELHPRRPC